MTRKKVTKKDPRIELSRYLAHQESRKLKKNKRGKKKKTKLSASLSRLHFERKHAITQRLGGILLVSIIAIICLAYYVSPLANVREVQVHGASDIASSKIVKAAGIKASKKVLDYRFSQKKLSQKLASRFPEIDQVQVRISHINRLNLLVKEKAVIGYVKVDNYYRKILANGKLGSQKLNWDHVKEGSALFVGYSHSENLKQDLAVFNDLPGKFRSEVKMMSGVTKRPTQIIFVMKNGNVVIGNLRTIKHNIKYYFPIAAKNPDQTMIDLEVNNSAFSRKLNAREKKEYDIS